MKNYLLRSSFFLLFLLSFLSYASAQGESKWVYVQTQDNLEFYYALSKCESERAPQLTLKIVNIGAEAKSGAYWITIEESNSRRDEYFFIENLAAGSEVQGGCSFSVTNKLIFNVQSVNGLKVSFKKS